MNQIAQRKDAKTVKHQILFNNWNIINFGMDRKVRLSVENQIVRRESCDSKGCGPCLANPIYEVGHCWTQKACKSTWWTRSGQWTLVKSNKNWTQETRHAARALSHKSVSLS